MPELIALVERKLYKAQIAAVLLTAVFLVLFCLSLVLGRADISVYDAAIIIWGKLTGLNDIYSHLKASKIAIIWDIRLPRTLCAAIVGIGLAVAGTVFQAVLENPLADSYTIGVSPGAAFGASLAIYISMFGTSSLPVGIFAFLGAVLSLAIVLSISRVEGYASSGNLIIAGIIVGCVLSSAISLIKSMSGEQVSAIVSWLIGSLAARSWQHVYFSLVIVPVCTLICIFYSRDLNILSLGDREARNLGINADRTRKMFLILGAFITAACVAVSGIIGFVGLIVPHIMRMAAGSDNRILVPLSGLAGGVLLTLADLLGRVILDVEVPVGVLTTLLGGPFFFYIFRTRNRVLQ